MSPGQNLSEQQLIEKLKLYDTPAVTNVVATYPGDPLCLGLYNPWTQNWYTDQTIRCMYPEIGRLAGYAVTCVFGLPDPNYNHLSFMDVIDAIEESKKPVILIIKQIFPKKIAGKAGLSGGNMTAALKSIGCIGVISDGPSRDIDEIRPMRFQYMLTGVTAGHGDMAVHAINTPVSVGSMDVSPGEIIHMDENGACKFPADKLKSVVSNLEALAKTETERMAALAKAKSAAEIRAIFEGNSYNKADVRE
jgi:4-hydroxy-4-methyl-2-oxoglutarate aldolase